jgi:SAM-dependent methyltransferase
VVAVSESFDYGLYHVDLAARRLADVRGKRALVVGCNRGREVSLFLDAGASEVWGIDVMDEIGIEFPRRGAHYLQMSAEAMNFDDEMFEIVFCVATMEHIAGIESAFAEIARVTKTGGFVYVHSAPLWNAREGHHRGNLFDLNRYPWIHLRFTSDELKRMCADGRIEYPESVDDIDSEIDLIMTSDVLNRRPARDYLRVCSGLVGFEFERNRLEFEPPSVLELLSEGDLSTLGARGIDALELRAVMHTFGGWKGRLPQSNRRIRGLTRPRGSVRSAVGGAVRAFGREALGRVGDSGNRRQIAVEDL